MKNSFDLTRFKKLAIINESNFGPITPVINSSEYFISSDGKYVKIHEFVFRTDTLEEVTALTEDIDWYNIIHGAVDISSMVADFIVPGSGAAIDLVHGLEYMVEANMATNEDEKDMKIFLGIITLAFAVAPGVLQAAAIPLKNWLKLISTTKKMVVPSKVVAIGIKFITNNLDKIFTLLPKAIESTKETTLGKKILVPMLTKIEPILAKGASIVKPYLEKFNSVVNVNYAAQATTRKAMALIGFKPSTNVFLKPTLGIDVIANIKNPKRAKEFSKYVTPEAKEDVIKAIAEVKQKAPEKYKELLYTKKFNNLDEFLNDILGTQSKRAGLLTMAQKYEHLEQAFNLAGKPVDKGIISKLIASITPRIISPKNMAWTVAMGAAFTAKGASDDDLIDMLPLIVGGVWVSSKMSFVKRYIKAKKIKDMRYIISKMTPQMEKVWARKIKGVQLKNFIKNQAPTVFETTLRDLQKSIVGKNKALRFLQPNKDLLLVSNVAQIFTSQAIISSIDPDLKEGDIILIPDDETKKELEYAHSELVKFVDECTVEAEKVITKNKPAEKPVTTADKKDSFNDLENVRYDSNNKNEIAFDYINLKGEHISAKGVRVEFKDLGVANPLEGATYYKKTTDRGPKLFAVKANFVYYYKNGAWEKFNSAKIK